MLKKNIGGTERAVRVLAGLVIISFGFVGPQTPWAFLGVIPLATGLIGWCPPYAVLGVSTCKSCCKGGCEGDAHL